MDYSFGTFKLNITAPLARVDGGLQREVTRAQRDQELVVGTYNVENLDPGDGGAFARHAGLIVGNLRSPDLLAIEEVQDNDGPTNSSVTDASVTWRLLVDAIAAAGGPQYQYGQIDPVDDQDGGEPGGNILGIGVGGESLAASWRPGWDWSLPRWPLRRPPGAAVPTQPDAVGWRRGAAGERRTARPLDPLARHGWAILHDLAVPGSSANIDHLVIGPGGVLVIDSKHYRGRLQLDPSGRLWHGRYPLAPTLRAVDFEADRTPRSYPTSTWWWCRSWPSTALRSPGARWPPTGCRWWRPGACHACCAPSPAVLGPERVAALADQARIRFHAAA